MTTVKLTANDDAVTFTNPTGEPLEVDGVTLDLTGASILFLMKKQNAPYTAYSFNAAIDGTATNGNVKYVMGTGFPTDRGMYKQQWQVTLSGGKKLTFPNGDFNYIEIEEDLNG